MRIAQTIILDQNDRPHVEPNEDVDPEPGEEPWVTVKLSPEVSIMGPVDVVSRWADDLQMAVRTS